MSGILPDSSVNVPMNSLYHLRDRRKKPEADPDLSSSTLSQHMVNIQE